MAAGTYAPSGFFVVRTPLLPYSALAALSEGLAAVSVLADGGDLGAALARDRERVLRGLRGLVEQAEIREALFVASPSLDDALTAWLTDSSAPRAHDVPEILIRYLARMAARPTPFGLFSGCSLGQIGTAGTRLTLAPRTEYRRHTRLDTHYLAALAEALDADVALRGALLFRPSSGLYAAAGKLRYAEAQTDPKTRAISYKLVAVDRTPYLDATLARATGGASPVDLAAALCADDPDITREEAEAFVASLIESQILVSDTAPTMTGPPPIDGIIDAVRAAGPPGEHAAVVLTEAREAALALDQEGLGHAPSRYRAIAQGLAALPAEPELARLFQVDLHKPVLEATIGPAVVSAIREAIEIVARLGPPAPDETMRRFREAFAERYGERAEGPIAERQMVPLAEALDDEAGLGFASTLAGSSEPSPLLDGLDMPPDPAPPSVPFGPRQSGLLRGIANALAAGRREWALDDADLAALGSKEPARLPDAFAFMGLFAAPSAAALERGELRLLVESVSGPSGALLLGRFCHADPALRHAVEAHLRAEEAMRPEAVFAEIVHLAEGRLGNILARPTLRAYEIAYHGRSGAPRERQIPITDLYLTLDHGKFVLFSKRLGREVIPRLTSAHNFAIAPLGIYRFLCALQADHDRRAFGWSWGALGSSPFLPRVARGRIVLSLARWNLAKEELAPLAKGTDEERFRAVQELRGRRGLPRWVALADGDNVLPVDLDNAVCVTSLVALVAHRDTAAFVEMFPSTEELVAEGPEGRYVHEVVVPFVRSLASTGVDSSARATATSTPTPTSPSTPTPTKAPSLIRRTFAPGSEWLYAKLYTGTASADIVLTEIVAPLVASEEPKDWFFIRYGDPNWHVRLRLHGDPKRLAAKTLPALHELATPLIDDGRVTKLQLDTYEREVERYGGPDGIGLAEALFQADSDATLAIVGMLDADDGADARWRLTLRGMHLLLLDLGLTLEQRTETMRRVRAVFAAEHGVDVGFEKQLGTKFRALRPSLEALLATPLGTDHALDAGFEVLAERSEKIVPIARELATREADRRLRMAVSDLAPSFLHMHANRLLRSEQRSQELVLYDFLSRLYESETARSKKRS
jgi:thiopeptide-type bacteriocin biosynthesis protein